MELKFLFRRYINRQLTTFNRTICGIEIDLNPKIRFGYRTFNRTICGIEIRLPHPYIRALRALLIAPFVELKYIMFLFVCIPQSLLIAPFVELKCRRKERNVQTRITFNRTICGIEISL